MLLSCSDKVSNITISPSSPKNCYKPISKIAPIYSAKTVSSSWWQCKLLGLNYATVIQRGLSKRVNNSQAQIWDRPSPGSSPSLSLLQAAGVLTWNSLLLLLRTQDGAQSHSCLATLDAVQLQHLQDLQTQEQVTTNRSTQQTTLTV